MDKEPPPRLRSEAEARADYQKAYREANKEATVAYRKAYNEANKEAKALSNKAYREANKEATVAYQKAYQKAYRGANKVTSKIYKHRRRARMANNGVFTVSKKEIAKLMSSPCIYCGAIKDITIEHLIPIHRGGTHGVGNLSSACRSCNLSKGSKFITEWKKIKSLT